MHLSFLAIVLIRARVSAYCFTEDFHPRATRFNIILLLSQTRIAAIEKSTLIDTKYQTNVF